MVRNYENNSTTKKEYVCFINHTSFFLESYYWCVFPKTGEEVYGTRIRFIRPKCDLTGKYHFIIILGCIESIELHATRVKYGTRYDYQAVQCKAFLEGMLVKATTILLKI